MEGNGIDVVTLGDGRTASMQVVQQIYRDVTGKTEQLSKGYDLSHHTVWNDFESLNSRVTHLLEQYNVVERGCAVTISYIDSSSERFSSFDRARGFDAGSNSPVESVTLEFNFLIILPIAKKPELYKLVVQVSSGAALRERAETRDQFESTFLRMVAERTGFMSIEYIDYAVARNFQQEVDRWFGALQMTQSGAIVKVLKRTSHHFPWILKYGTAAFVAFFFVYEARGIQSILALSDLFRLGLIAFAAVFISAGVAERLGQFFEMTVDFYQNPSYIRLNRGDERVIAANKRSVGWGIARASGSLIGAIVVNILAALLASYLHLPK